VTLSQAQSYLEIGAQKGFHAWYRDAEAEKVSRSSSFRLATEQRSCRHRNRHLPQPISRRTPRFSAPPQARVVCS
jgi:hypothetical protein